MVSWFLPTTNHEPAKQIHNRTDKQYTVLWHPSPHGGVIGLVEHHSESLEALFAHTAGLRIVTLRPRTRRTG